MTSIASDMVLTMRFFLLLSTTAFAVLGHLKPDHPWQRLGTHHGRWIDEKLPRAPTSRPWRIISRGGGVDTDQTNDKDEERYSRQVYTLGARAHALVRSATVYLDGPSTSGLTYETAKNLALSGIGRIVVLTSQSQLDKDYHYEYLDDLGRTYVRGARAELGIQENDDLSLDEVLVEFLRRLNPSLQVGLITREQFETSAEEMNGVTICVDRPYDTQLHMSRICRERKQPFVAAETAGVFGRIFSDFGDDFGVHDMDGETPAVVPLDRVEKAEGGDNGLLLVRAVAGEKHDVSKGDEIRFQLSSGESMTETCIVSKVLTPEKILVETKSDNQDGGDAFVSKVNSQAASFSRQKQLVRVSFLSLEEATQKAGEVPSLFTPCDFDKTFDDIRKSAIFNSFQSLNAFVKKHETLPLDDQVQAFVKYLEKEVPGMKDNEKWKDHCRMFASRCAAKFVPLQAIFGAISAQECLKAVSGLYNPIQQFLLYDCDEVIGPDDAYRISESATTRTGLEYVMGEEITKMFRSRKLFVVGAGAIGCELLKNLAAMDAGSCGKGVIVVTDMDTIERSNLSRQLLFRDGDISKFKSKAAEEAVARLNPSVKLEAHTSKVGDVEMGPFDSNFWSKKVHIVLNALDNMDARLFMDGQCVANEKALIDAGTLGSKGNVQVVVPHLSESYASSADPPEQSIPVCTLKNFPYSITHTIQWGRDLFDGLYARRPKQANQYSDIISFSSASELKVKLVNDLGESSAVELAQELAQDLIIDDATPTSEVRKQALEWAVKLAKKLFCESIETLLNEHPIDSLDDDGEPFWSGSRKPPTMLSFPSTQDDSIDENLLNFVRYAARLRVETYLGPSTASDISAEDAWDAILAAQSFKETHSADSDIETLTRLLCDSELSKSSLHVAEFEKDDESNGHVAFITAASNIRAMCYGIPPVDAMETRRVAGRIVPAMITTTAFVSALSCIELVKLVQDRTPLKRYRNAFINLALPFFAFTTPLPAEQIEGLRGETFTLWDRIKVKESKRKGKKLTLRRLLTKVKKQVGGDPDTFEIASVSFGQYMIYANFLNEGEDELLDKDLWQVVQEAVNSGNEFDSSFSRDTKSNGSAIKSQVVDGRTLDLTVIVEDLETGDEVELPPIKALRST